MQLYLRELPHIYDSKLICGLDLYNILDLRPRRVAVVILASTKFLLHHSESISKQYTS